MIYVREAKGSVDEVRQRVEEATAANQFGVLGVLDLQSKMAAKGVDYGAACLVIEVCSPGKAKTVLEIDPRASSALPCRISVYEDGDKVKVASINPTALIDLYGNAALRPVAEDVEATIVRIIDSACG